MSVEKTLIERGSRYGIMENNAELTQRLIKIVIDHGHKREDLTSMQNMHDIGGYAKLLEEFQIAHLQNKKEPDDT